MAENTREPLRTTFDEAAELYDRARPGYPPELFGDLVDLAGLRPGARVLEIGCGTGQATLPLAERKFQITAIELGPNLAAIAHQKLVRFANVAVIVTAFENWPLPPEPFDAVISATAFHWLDPAVRVTRAANALRPGGVLATIATHHIDGGDAQFFIEVQDCYRRWSGFPSPSGEGRVGACPRRPRFRKTAANSSDRDGSSRLPSGDTSGNRPTRRPSTPIS